ncbi:hypothetical protein ACFVZC_30130 [Streptomyces marokkonensis]|uniref:Uncharacterized protein n=1 Tax=Streptomyces marokkonensis TaxID=324855 RepID=A0ABW6QEG9_9ACTN
MSSHLFCEGENTMDPIVVAAGSALVAAMATDAWQQAQAGLVRLWQRVHPAQTDAVEEELAEVRTQVLSARDAGDAETERALTGSWQWRLQLLLRDDPALAEELRRLLDDTLAPAVRAHTQTDKPSTVINGTARDSSRLYIAGVNQYFR